MSINIQIGFNELYIEHFLLDKENPRLPPEAVDYSQSELCNILERRFNLDSLADSIVNYGFFRAEPLVGIFNDDKSKVIVIEGNRRLAILKLMTDEEINKKSINPKKWHIRYKELKKNGHTIGKISVMVYKERKEINAFLGYRHITRTLEWEPLAKARFINKIVEEGNIRTFKEAARVMNSRSDTVRNNYVAYRVLVQAEEEYKIYTENVENRFGVFYTALNNTNIRNFIGLKREQQIKKLRKPISKKKSNELKNLISTLHGEAKVDPVFTDSRNISKLGKILINDNARKVLLKTRDMKEAEKYLEKELDRILDNFDVIIDNLRVNIKLVHKYCGNKKIIKKMNELKNLYEKLIQTCNKINKDS